MKLKTERLILRKPRMSDWKDLLEGLNDKELLKKVIPFEYPISKEDILEKIKVIMKEWKKEKKTNYIFSIEVKSENKVIGEISINNLRKKHKTAETGSWINKKYQRKGYILEAKIAVNEFAFNELKLRKLLSPIFVENKPSISVQKKIGYKLEGRLRKQSICTSTGKIHDEYIFGLLKEDWKKISSKLKKELKEKIKRLEK
ncbi:GNAT family N-acetyltransferase [archaeon]|nr:GNAT family N-acetyltransferase [archaeon]